MSWAGPSVAVDWPGRPVGAVVAYGRRFVGRGAHTENLVPPVGNPYELVPVDVASWGATLLARRVFDAGIVPDPEWFFGLEDFDFFCRVRQGGFDVLVDAVSARAVADQQTSAGRAGALGPHRPTDERETWRSYYHARNSILLARRHGRPSWHLWHLAYSARHLQKATGNVERKAILHGLWDGARGRFGENPDYGRTVGELPEANEDPGSPLLERWQRLLHRVGRRVLDGLAAAPDDSLCRRSASSPFTAAGRGSHSRATSTAGLTRHVRDRRHPRPDRVDECRPAGRPGVDHGFVRGASWARRQWPLGRR